MYSVLCGWSILRAGEVGWANVWKTQGGAVRSLTNIYSLTIVLRLAGTVCTTPVQLASMLVR